MQQVEGINNDNFKQTILQQNWKDFIQKNSNKYFKYLSVTNSISNRYLRAGFNRLGIGKMFINKQYLKLILNLTRCEAHADVLKTSIKKYLKGNK